MKEKNLNKFEKNKFISTIAHDKPPIYGYYVADFETLVVGSTHYIYACQVYYDYIKYLESSPQKDQSPEFHKLSQAAWNYTGIITNPLLSEKTINKESQDLLSKFMDNLLLHARNLPRARTEKGNFISKVIPVYFHNLGSFDGIFLLKFLLKKEQDKYRTSLVIRHGSIYSITLHYSYKNQELTLKFLDSYKLLPKSLDNLAKDLLGERKIIFDHSQVNCSYIKENFNKILEYLNQDVKILAKIICLVHKSIFKDFRIDIFKRPTASSLAYAIYRSEFLPDLEKNQENLIAKSTIQKTHYDFLQNSYRGGICEVYRPYGENLYNYDIVSSYAFSMLQDMPVGEPQVVHRKDLNPEKLDDFFGFFTVKVYVPPYNDNDYRTYLPLLGIYNDHRTIYPTGSFVTTVFSEELKIAQKTYPGFKIQQIYFGLKYKRGKIFNTYVNNIFEKRLKSTNPTDIYLYKLLLNSLYGRFGMKYEISKTEIISTDHIMDYTLFYNIYDIIMIKDLPYCIVNYNNIPDQNVVKRMQQLESLSDEIREKLNKKINKSKNESITHNIATQMSSAIAAYGRIHIHNIKMDILSKGGKIYYSDTDSIITDIPMETSTKLGGLKLENKIKKGWFAGPKVYLMITKENKEIKKFKGLVDKEKKKLTIEDYENMLNQEKKLNINYIKPVKKNLKKLSIMQILSTYSTNFNKPKRKKIYDDQGKWYNTIPYDLQVDITNIDKNKDKDNRENRIKKLREIFKIYAKNDKFKKWLFQQKDQNFDPKIISKDNYNIIIKYIKYIKNINNDSKNEGNNK